MSKKDTFLGRCSHCLDNAFSDDKCNGPDYACIVKLTKKARREKKNAKSK